MAADLRAVDFDDIRHEAGAMFDGLNPEGAPGRVEGVTEGAIGGGVGVTEGLPGSASLTEIGGATITAVQGDGPSGNGEGIGGVNPGDLAGDGENGQSAQETQTNSENSEQPLIKSSTGKDSESGTFQCPLCKQMFERNEKLFDHIRWQHALICLVCSKVCEDDDSLMFHISTHSMKLPSNCKQCLVGFSDLARLQCHMIDHMNNSKLGQTSGKHVNAMTNYERLEGGYYCKKCKKNFDTADAYHTHAFVDHKPYNSKRNTDFVCGYCSESFSTLQQLKIHQNTEHESSLQKSVRCFVCEEVFSTNREMRVHVRKEHKPNYYYKTWSSKFSHNAINKAKGLPRVKKKMRIKSKEVKLCVDCGATFKTDDTLKRHTLMQHSEGHTKPVCQICGKDFWTRGDLRVHIKRHMNRENRRFTCDRCGKVFGSNASLLIHQRIHTGEKPYECPECKKVFRTDSCLNRHRRIHKGLFPHTCEICQKKFRTMSNLRQHLKQRFVHKHIEGHPKPQSRHETTTTEQQQQQQQQHVVQLQQQSHSNANTSPRQPAGATLWPGVYQQMGGVWPTPPQAHQQVAAAAAAALQHEYYL